MVNEKKTFTIVDNAPYFYFHRMNPPNRWLSDVSVGNVKEKLKSMKTGIVIDPIFLENFMNYAQVKLSNTYDDVRIRREDLLSPVAPPERCATMMLAVETMGMKMPYPAYKFMIGSLLEPSRVAYSCIHLGRVFSLNNPDVFQSPVILYFDPDSEVCKVHAHDGTLYHVFGNKCICLYLSIYS